MGGRDGAENMEICESRRGHERRIVCQTFSLQGIAMTCHAEAKHGTSDEAFDVKWMAAVILRDKPSSRSLLSFSRDSFCARSATHTLLAVADIVRTCQVCDIWSQGGSLNLRCLSQMPDSGSQKTPETSRGWCWGLANRSLAVNAPRVTSQNTSADAVWICQRIVH